MYGALLGDMIGAPYEFDQGDKTKDFPLFGRRSECTDDSVMTIAVAEALSKEPFGSINEEVGKKVSGCRLWRKIYLVAHAGRQQPLW